MRVNPLDDIPKAGRQTHRRRLDAVPTRSDMEPWRILGQIDHRASGRAGKYKNKSCNVPKPEVHVDNQSCEDDVETQLVRRWRAHAVGT